MAEEFQTGICGGNYWWNNINSTRSVFPLSSSPCSVAANDAGGIGYSTWQTDDMVELKAATRSCADHEEIQETNSNSNMVSDSTSPGFLDATKPLLQRSSDQPAACTANNGGSILMDSNSTLQMIGFGLSSNWNNHSLFRCSGKPAESNFQETGIDSSSNLPITQEDWRPKSFSSSSASTMDDDAFKHMNHQDLCGGFPTGSASHGYPSALIQSLYDPHPIPQPHSLFTNRCMAYSSTASANYGVSSHELSPTSWSKPSSFLKQQMPSGQFSNNSPFWNASTSAEAINDMRADVFGPSSQPQQYQISTSKNDKPNFPSALITKPKSEQAPDSASAVKKCVGEPAIKRQKIDTPSPLPTFKVRKEKLGDRITALQQLVSPFGKTDTASVLHEAIEYIKFLHEQVSVLSTPYMKNGAPIQHQQGSDLKELEGPKKDLRSRGLCLVPISSTFPVTNETTADFWTPSFGGVLIR